MGVDQQTGKSTIHSLVSSVEDDLEFDTAHSATNVADDATAYQVVFSQPSSASHSLWVVPAYQPGGQAELIVSEDIAIDTAGTALTVASKNAQSGATLTTTIEQGGSYTVNGTSLSTILVGTTASNKQTTPEGTPGPGLGAKLLNPGDSVMLEMVNRSGGATSFGLAVGLVKV